MRPGQKVRITIETTLDEVEDHTDARMHPAGSDDDFGLSPFYFVKYGGTYSLELPTYHIAGTRVQVEQVNEGGDGK